MKKNYEIENPVTSEKSKREAVERWERVNTKLSIKLNKN